MLNDDTRKRLENIIRGNVIEGQESNLTAARNYLCQSFRTSTTVKKDFDNQSRIKEEQKKQLIAYATLAGFWFDNIDESKYLTEGGEAKIYLALGEQTVLKVNDAIYYSTWLDFLNSILIHNLFFEKTSYTLKGFKKHEHNLYAVLEQPFIVEDSQTDLGDVNVFLAYNGFKNVRRNDYYNKELGLILEDVHDENVLTSSNTLFFIDTVFYIHVFEG